MTSPAALARRLDLVVHDLRSLGRAARWTYAPVVWDDLAMDDLETHLERQDADLTAIVDRITECATALRGLDRGGR